VTVDFSNKSFEALNSFVSSKFRKYGCETWSYLSG